MTRRESTVGILASAVVVGASSGAARAEAQEAIELPPRRRSDGGRSLVQALELRRSTREYSGGALPLQLLSDLLWAAFGINRPNGDRRRHTGAASWSLISNVATREGAWIYDPELHSLLPLWLATSARKRVSRTSWESRRSISCMSLMVSACRNCPPRNAGSTLRSIRVHRAKCLPVLCLTRLGDSVPGSGRLSKTGPCSDASGRAIRDICPNRALFARMNPSSAQGPSTPYVQDLSRRALIIGATRRE